MRFIPGLLIGAAIGSLCTVAYSVRSDRDLRSVYARARTTLAPQDLGARAAGVQTDIGNRIARARGRAPSVDDAPSAAAAAMSDVEHGVAEVVAASA
jgi:hypothetical protein